MSAESRYQIVTNELANACLRIQWRDGHCSEFHPIWLRHQCECSDCGTPLNAVRALRIYHIPADISIASIEHQHGCIRIVWSNDHHRSEYSARWLRDHCYSLRERQARKHRPILWDHNIGDNPPAFDFAAAEGDPSCRLEMLEAVADYGFCKIVNSPGDLEQAERLISLVGARRQTHFGFYQLSKKPSINNVGDIKHELVPHCDETYRTSTIGITVFQVIRPAKVGGDSTLMDGFEAVRRLRDTDPDGFDLLTRLPVFAQRLDTDYLHLDMPRLYQCRLPVIRLDEDGDVVGVRINERQISLLDVAPELIEPTYSALRNLMKIVYEPDLLIQFPLKKGEGLLFNNQRVLHGRTAFETETPGRSVLTNSVDLEDFYSNLRMLTSKLKPDQPPTTYTQGLVT
ncbi:MAG: TauD/TfdA family dioxygenase [Pseudomonadota bacterium]